MATFGENQGIARTYLPSLINQGFSGNTALNFLKEQGLSYRRQDFQADWREFTGLEKKKDTFKYIRPDLKPTAKTFTETSENLSKEYSYIFHVEGKDSITGEPKETGWRLATDDLLSLNEAMEMAEEYMVTEEYKQDITDYKITTTGVKKALHL